MVFRSCRARGWTVAALVALSAFWAPSPCRAYGNPRPYVPQVGDVADYTVSNGDRAEARVVGIEVHGDRTYADIDQIITHQDGSHQETRFRLIRTDTAVALDIPQEGENGHLSPLVYFLSDVAPHDTWVAQQGAFEDADGNPVHYQLVAQLEGIETVRLACGTFPGCYRITYHVAAADAPQQPGTTMTIWFDPRVGIVRTRTVNDQQVTETDLSSYVLQQH